MGPVSVSQDGESFEPSNIGWPGQMGKLALVCEGYGLVGECCVLVQPGILGKDFILPVVVQSKISL
jgi:hypothetical protein